MMSRGLSGECASVKEILRSGAGGLLWEEGSHGGNGEHGFSEEPEMGMTGDLLGWGEY